jgi:hypothetical protein
VKLNNSPSQLNILIVALGSNGYLGANSVSIATQPWAAAASFIHAASSDIGRASFRNRVDSGVESLVGFDVRDLGFQ